MPNLALGLGTQYQQIRFRGLLDEFGGAAAAYSLRALDSSFVSQDVVLVRRSSDNAEEGFTPAEITGGQLESFCGVGDGFVKTWYDQSGNAQDATQATAANQPQIVSSGSLVVGGVDFNGTTHTLTANSLAPTLSGNDNNIDSFIVGANERTTDAGYAYSLGNTTNPSPQLHAVGANGTVYRIISRDDASVISIAEGGTFSAEALVSGIDGGDDISIRENGSLVASDSDAKGQRTFDTFSIGALNRQGAVNAYYDGTMREIIIYGSDQSGNRAAIEANINDYYSIY